MRRVRTPVERTEGWHEPTWVLKGTSRQRLESAHLSERLPADRQFALVSAFADRPFGPPLELCVGSLERNCAIQRT
jgi:hypothetical protein